MKMGQKTGLLQPTTTSKQKRKDKKRKRREGKRKRWKERKNSQGTFYPGLGARIPKKVSGMDVGPAECSCVGPAVGEGFSIMLFVRGGKHTWRKATPGLFLDHRQPYVGMGIFKLKIQY